MTEEIHNQIKHLQEENYKLKLALRNCRALASRNTTQPNDDWHHVIKWCEEAGIKASLLRGRE